MGSGTAAVVAKKLNRNFCGIELNEEYCLWAAKRLLLADGNKTIQYIDEDLKDIEQVVGLQTDKPLKRAFMPYGGIKMAEQSCKMYGYEPRPKLHEIFTKYHKTHNQGVFDIYTPCLLYTSRCV